ncbi:MAG: MaoC family dehydratase [Desulfovibrio sp.]|jgi:acyl dehydratase|nr:MaoC family dehydratase [Desulfovibrio sp.]
MSVRGFTAPREDRYLEDYVPGMVFEFDETVTLTEKDILDFAAGYDPQVFHTDPVKAEESIYKGLIASGAHTISVTFRILVKNFLPGKASFGSPGMDELRWLKPVRPGDCLRLRVTITDVQPSRSKNDRGTVFSFLETVNQDDEVVMSFKGRAIMAKRHPG